MPSERRITGDRRAPTTVSVRRLEGKVDQVIKRQDEMYLNGDAAALRDLAKFWRDSGSQLQRLVEAAPSLIEAIERDTEMRVFWKVMRRHLNPLKPIGAFVWLLITTVGSATVWNIATAQHWHFGIH